MSEIDAPKSPVPTAPIRAAWRFTEAELAAYWRISHNRTTGHQAPYDGEWTTRIVAIVLSVGVQFAALALGVITDPRNPTIAIACLVAIYITLTAQDWLVRRYWTRYRADVAKREVDLDCSFLMDETGIVFERAHAKHTFAWAAIHQVTAADGLLLFWTDDKEASPVPTRAFAETDRSRAFQMAKMRGVVQPGPGPGGSKA